MSNSPFPSQPSDDLQFDTVEAGQAAGPSLSAPQCAICRQPIASCYYSLRDDLLCPSCGEQVANPPAGGVVVRFLKAAFLGVAAGAAGAVAWCVIRAMTGLVLGLLAMVVGYMVGMAAISTFRAYAAPGG